MSMPFHFVSTHPVRFKGLRPGDLYVSKNIVSNEIKDLQGAERLAVKECLVLSFRVQVAGDFHLELET